MTWKRCCAAGLAGGFLREAGLWYALAHELKINDAYVPAAKAEIEARPGVCKAA
jgi:hypothetical protein